MNLEEVARHAKSFHCYGLPGAQITLTSSRTPRWARVMKAVEELKYHPNLHARSLAGGKSRSIGVIVSNIENPFFLDIYKAVESRRAYGGL